MSSQEIVITANFTAEPVQDSLEFWLDQFDLAFEIRFAPFDQVFQQLLDPTSALSTNNSGINILLLKLDNWARPADDSTSCVDAAVLRRNVDELADALSVLVARQPAQCLVVCCPAAPGVLRDPAQNRVMEGAQADLVTALKSAPGVQVFTPADIVGTYPVDEYYDAAAEALGQIPYTDDFFAALGTVLARRVRQLRSAPYKVIALDCDNTLWQGIVGELGAQGIMIDPATREFQEFLVRQHDAGVLLCLSSKNNEADVAEVFATRSDMALRHEHFLASRVNWEPKSENLRSLARELNVGLDSFIFIDDSPFEIAEVRAQCPEVLALPLPADPEGIRRLMTHCWAFDRRSVTAEDLKRADSYRQNKHRDAVFKDAGSLDDFLQKLELVVTVGAPGPADLARVAQMTQRTNQFNASTIRRGEPEVQALLSSGKMESRIVRVQDRFGDYGVVGVMLFEVRGNALWVDTLLLSCRALGRRVEHRMLVELGMIAAARSCQTIEIPFVRTARNTPVLAFLNSLGTTQAAIRDDHTFTVATPQAVDALALPVAMVDPAAFADERAPRATDKRVHAAQSEAMARTYVDLYSAGQVRAAIAKETRRAPRQAHREMIEPRTASERRIADIWKRVLRLEAVSVRDSFFDLGGTSLAAVPIFAELGRQVSSRLTPYLLFEAPTIEQLAALIDRDESGRASAFAKHTSLVTIRGTGSRRPLFLVHAGAGSILFYYPLADALGSEQPVYGLQAQGLDGRGMAHASVEQMAAHYLSEIRTVQASGPYQLGGFCFGATIAFEMAQQLRRVGEHVSFLASFDGLAPSFRDLTGRPKPAGPVIVKRNVLPRWARLLPAEFWRGLLYHADSLRVLPTRERAAYPFRKAAALVGRTAQRWRNRAMRAYTNRTGGPVPNIFRSFWWYFHLNHLLAKGRYTAALYTDDMFVFTLKGRYREPQLGWNRWITGQLTTLEVPGELRSHRDLLHQPIVGAVAEQMSVFLSRSTERTGQIVNSPAG